MNQFSGLPEWHDFTSRYATPVISPAYLQQVMGLLESYQFGIEIIWND
jgi:hypothetical protein